MRWAYVRAGYIKPVHATSGHASDKPSRTPVTDFSAELEMADIEDTERGSDTLILLGNGARKNGMEHR